MVSCIISFLFILLISPHLNPQISKHNENTGLWLLINDTDGFVLCRDETGAQKLEMRWLPERIMKKKKAQGECAGLAFARKMNRKRAHVFRHAFD